MSKLQSIKVILRNYSEPVEVTSIDFKTKTLTWDYRGHLENVESFDDVESWEVEQ
jgi:hypothetical protein